ncbi:MAG: murein L,D-transpeptidase [Elusimicrobia bacterium]|nr:MAG: murein L,D-transpeptidase [Elusimicrobiota bacterium]
MARRPRLTAPVTDPSRVRLRVVCTLCLLATFARLSTAGEEPAWFNEQGPTIAARQAVERLSMAALDGLDANDYGISGWQREIERSVDGEELTADRIARLNAALASALHRYQSDLRNGRVQPQQVGFRYLVSGAREASAEETSTVAASVDDVTAAAPSRWPEYDSLRRALAAYRELAGHSAWANDLPPLVGSKLHPGQSYAGLARLRERLVALGDLSPDAESPPRYEGRLVEGVKAFQERHGLTPDGVIGKETFEQLKVPPQARVEQLELALERLRWTPLPRKGRLIQVNVPEFMLHAYRIEGDEVSSSLAMRVVVGTARKTPTPIFSAPMRAVEFNPYWNIPPSILRDETLPRLQRDPAFFARQGYELVSGDGRVIDSLPEDGLTAIAQGQMRIRQRPGAGNALGDIKFVLPNGDNIYLHYTPSVSLFKRDRRDFSHGCIRVEAPVDLAEFVLSGSGEWTRNRIVQTKKSGRSLSVRVHDEVPVVIAYRTATVRNDRVYFFPDLYGHDRTLREALRQRSATLQGQGSRLTAVGQMSIR